MAILTKNNYYYIPNMQKKKKITHQYSMKIKFHFCYYL